MTTQVLRDASGTRLGEVRDSGTSLRAYDQAGTFVGEYRNGRSYDKAGNFLGEGNHLSMLIVQGNQ